MKWYQKLTWFFLKLTFGNFLKWFYGLKKIDFADEPDEPYVLLSNHAHHLDAFLIAVFLNKPIRYLGSDENASILQQILGKLVGLIYTDKGNVDPKAVRALYKSIKEKVSIGIFPEGDGSWDGETEPFYLNTIKMVRRFNLPVRTVRIRGGFLTQPRWGFSMRKGSITVEMDTLSRECIGIMSDEELYHSITNKLYQNDIKDNLQRGVRFDSKKAAGGVSRLLWKCPVCQSEDTLNGSGNTVRCTHCGNEWTINANMEIVNYTLNPEKFADLKDWSDYQKDLIRQSLESGHDHLAWSGPVKLSKVTGRGRGINRMALKTGKTVWCNLALTRTHLIFSDTLTHQVIRQFPLEAISGFVDCQSLYCRFKAAGETWLINFGAKNSSRYHYYFKWMEKQPAQIPVMSN
jgi:1-acyl-sn-glycerol-3-phosphate acyltransferase